VKTRPRLPIVLLFVTVYCFAIALINLSSSFSENPGSESPEQEQYVSAISANLFCHTTLSEKGEPNFGHFPGMGFKKSFTEWRTIVRITELLFDAAFVQYSGFAENFLVQYRKSDLIFPFHYFW
jgi:hypothetical protein